MISGNIYRIFAGLILWGFYGCAGTRIPDARHLKKLQATSNYPSASAIEYVNGKFYTMGDDAPDILQMNGDFREEEKISLYPHTGRIPGRIKHDVESMVVWRDTLFFFGSGSRIPQRSIAWKYHPGSKLKDSLSLVTFHQRLIKEGLKELNIEGSALVADRMVLGNRGNMSFPENYLAVTHPGFWNNQLTASIHLIEVESEWDSSAFTGISSLYYNSPEDQLFITVSTEYTSSTTQDGEIGPAYLWIINNLSDKLNYKKITPSMVVDLPSLDAVFARQKIEGITLIAQTRKKLFLGLAADNDDGQSRFFRIVVSK